MTPPVFAHGTLRLYLLALLEEEPRHGYELIQALSDRFGGTYSPSAGTIYPRLAKLEEEGLVTKTADGRKTVYAITDAGRTELDGRRHELDAIEDQVTDSVRRLADGVRAEVGEAMRSLRAELASAAREAKRTATKTRVDPAPAQPDAGRALHEAELALSEFRQAMRTELRSHEARTRLGADTVAILRAGLARTADEVRASLRA
ncbi:PadR family transcriptional regulator [Agromyces archimandritae]|uniref:Helix-turn-helix transcriptional regulator n=1 Tax=Agromyces archimandritae TaxID=2781962 RepID=A0A975FNN6_9MICO|nr:PadR family transcriptional regulator [Agromyces archimandritae]QTX05793.1 helix-turn-helix transcriptional regulator [Agromyces archimandritae]